MQRAFIWNSHLQVCLVRHHDEREKGRGECNAMGCRTSSIEKKMPKQTGRRIHVCGIGCIAFTAEDSKQGLKSVKMKMENWAMRSEDIQERYLFHQDWWIPWWLLYMEYNASTMWISSTRSIIYCRSWIRNRRKRTWRRKADNLLHSSWFFQQRCRRKQLQISRNRGRRIIKFIDDLIKMQSVEFTCPWRRNEFWQTVSKPTLRTSLCWKNAS